MKHLKQLNKFLVLLILIPLYGCNNSEFEEIRNKINNNLESMISESNTFDTSIDEYEVSYKVIKGNAYFNETSKSFKKTGENDAEGITVKTTIKNGKNSISFKKNLLLIDEYYGYLLVYFTDNGDSWAGSGSEKFAMAISNDRENWQTLDIELFASEGTGRFRDPYIKRINDNSFIITSTEAWDNPNIYIIKTNNLIDYDVNLVNISKHDETIGLDGDQCWAPEFFYDESKSKYTVIYSDIGETNAIYACDTKDFKTFGEPYIFYNSEYTVIDGNVSIEDGEYYFFFKDEANASIHYSLYDNSNDLFKGDYTIDANVKVEGPELFVDHRKKETVLYADAYLNGQIMVANIDKTNKFQNNVGLEIDEGISSIGNVRHFSIIEITKSEYERLRNRYVK